MGREFAMVMPVSVLDEASMAVARSGTCPSCKSPLEMRHVASPEGAMRFGNCRSCNALYVVASMVAVETSEPAAGASEKPEGT